MTTVAAAPHVVVAHHLIGMCSFGLPAEERRQAVGRALTLAASFHRDQLVAVAQWAGLDRVDRLSDLIVAVEDTLAGIIASNNTDPFDGLDGHDGHAPDKTERSAQARGAGRTPPEAA